MQSQWNDADARRFVDEYAGRFGADLAKEFIELKRMEWVEYSRHVSEWETSRYVEMF